MLILLQVVVVGSMLESACNARALCNLPTCEYVNKEESEELGSILVLPEYVLVVEEIGEEVDAKSLEIH